MNQKIGSNRGRSFGLRSIVSALLLAFVIAPAVTAAEELAVTGQILYGRAQGAQTGAVVDALVVYDQIPAYMRMQELGLSESDADGRVLFTKAQEVWKKALARIARDMGLDVITVPGGIEGVSAPDVTLSVIEVLPKYFVHGKLLHGRAQGAEYAENLAELDVQRVLDAIPAYRELQGTSDGDARHHMLRKQYETEFAEAVSTVARNGAHDVLVEAGGVTSRLGYVPEVTDSVIEALGS